MIYDRLSEMTHKNEYRFERLPQSDLQAAGAEFLSTGFFLKNIASDFKLHSADETATKT